VVVGHDDGRGVHPHRLLEHLRRPCYGGCPCSRRRSSPQAHSRSTICSGLQVGTRFATLRFFLY
jgi:hypothetical protein